MWTLIKERLKRSIEMSKIPVDIEIKDTMLKMVIRERLQKGPKPSEVDVERRKSVSTSGTSNQTRTRA